MGLPPASVEIGDAPEKGHGKVRRATVSKDKLIERPSEGNINSMGDVLEFAVKSEYHLSNSDILAAC